MRFAKFTLLLTFLAVVPVFAAQSNYCRIEVLVDGVPQPEYAARGVNYIEALKGKEYAIRITNPYAVRVAVALSVDGLNTIDARHSDPRSARKWILDPYQTVTISGWQTSSQQARRFFFTNEQNSYGAWLGKTQNLGIISAAFFREKERRPMPQPLSQPSAREDSRKGAQSAGAPAAEASKERAADSTMASRSRQEEYAATGIGRDVEHPVTQVYLDLESAPSAMVNIRYEYRSALISLGILPQPWPVTTPLQRRENARGFGEWAPSPPR